jgi:hypothetical protein
MRPRILTLRMAATLYVVAEPGDDESEYVRLTGFTQEQFIADLLARVSYWLGRDDTGRFRGSIVNDVMPLCDADIWSQQPQTEPRSWHSEGDLLRFYPWTLGDLFTVMRCGRPASYLERFDSLFGAMSQGGDGLELHHAAEAETFVFSVLSVSKLPVVRDCQELREYIDSDGNLNY